MGGGTLQAWKRNMGTGKWAELAFMIWNFQRIDQEIMLKQFLKLEKFRAIQTCSSTILQSINSCVCWRQLGWELNEARFGTKGQGTLWVGWQFFTLRSPRSSTCSLFTGCGRLSPKMENLSSSSKCCSTQREEVTELEHLTLSLVAFIPLKRQWITH